MFVASNHTMNHSTSNEWDQSEKKNSRFNTNLSRHEETGSINHKLKWNTSNAQGIEEQNQFPEKRVSINKLLSLILLPVIFIVCILKEPNCSMIKEKSLISTQRSRNQTCRILSDEIPVSKDKTNGFFGFSVEKKKSHWTEGLSKDVVKTCKEFLTMQLELKDRIFLNNEDFNAFLLEMEEKKKTVIIHAPELLNQKENTDVPNAKILNYWTDHVNILSKIEKLYNTLKDYEVLLNLFISNMWDRKTGKVATKEHENFSLYANKIKKYDLNGYSAMRDRLNQIQVQLEKSPFDDEKIYNAEMTIIEKTKTLCNRYKKILGNMERANNYRNPLQLFDLHYIERIMAADMPDFYKLHK